MTDTPHLSRRSALTALGGLGAGIALLPEGSAAAQAAPPAAPVDRRPRTHALVGQRAPGTDLALAGSGRRFTNAAFARRTTVVQFWGLWCPDCLADVDHVAELVRRLERERGIGFVSVHTRGRYGRWGALEPFFAEKGYRFPVAVDDDGAAYRAWQIGWVPSFLIIDRTGVIRDYTTDLVAGNGIGVEGLIARARAVASRRQPA